MRKNSLIYLIYILILLILTAYFSIRIISNKEMNIPVIGSFIAPIEKSSVNTDNERYIEALEYGSSSITKGRHDLDEEVYNSEGFKDYEHPIEKPNGTFRIIALGDSMTFGYLVDVNDTWPKQLETKLNKLDLSYKFEVFNFGIFGAGTLEEVKTFEEKGLEYNPDMVILAFYGNDWEDSFWIRNRTIKIWNEYKAGKFKLPEEIEKKAKEINASDGDMQRLFDLIAMDEFYNNTKQKGMLEVWNENVESPLLHLIDLCKSRNTRLIIVSWDLSWSFDLSEPELLKNFLDKNNIAYIDLSPYLPINYAQIRLPENKPLSHLSEVGYDIVSDKTIKFISPYLK